MGARTSFVEWECKAPARPQRLSTPTVPFPTPPPSFSTLFLTPFPSSPPTAGPDHSAAASSTTAPSTAVTTAPGGPPLPSRADPRPVADRAFQADAARRVGSFLTTHGYDGPLGPKTLASPTTKEFLAIMGFLARTADPGGKPLGRPEDDVPALFRRLRYPFAISKTALHSIGSSHTWPPLLAALAWLVELLAYRDAAACAGGVGGGLAAAALAAAEDVLSAAASPGSHRRPAGASPVEVAKVRSDRAFYAYVADSYGAYLAGDVGQRAASRASERRAAFDALEARETARAATLESEVSALQARLAALEAEPTPLAAAKARADEAAADRAELDGLIASLRGHADGLKTQLADAQARAGLAAEAAAAAQATAAAARKKVATQTLSVEDAARMERERGRLAGEVAERAVARAAAAARAAELEAGLAAALDALEAGPVADYNTAAAHLGLVPRAAKRSGGANLEARLDRDGAAGAAATGGDTTPLLGICFKGAVRPALERASTSIAQKTRDLEGERRALEERLADLEAAAKERSAEVTASEKAVARLEADVAADKLAADAEVATALAQADVLKAEVDALRGSAAGAAAAADAELAAAAASADEEVCALATEEAALATALEDAVAACLAHKEVMAAAVASAAAGVGAARDAVVEGV